jgi:hypothetical protein
VPAPHVLTSLGGKNHAFIQPSGGVNIAPPGNPLLSDPFDGTTIDTTYRWVTPVTAGGGTVTQASGNLIIATSTTASNAGALSSIETFQSVGAGFLGFGSAVVLEAAVGTNTHRFIGQGTPNASFTAATPLADAYGWEIDITGALNAVTYSGNVRTIWYATRPPSDGFPHIYACNVRSDAVFFFLDNIEEPIAVGGYQGASTSRLPYRQHMINHTSGPAAAPTFTSYGMAVLDMGASYPLAWNGQTISTARSPGKFINLASVAVNAETTLWTPPAGKRFRLMGYQLTATGAAGNVVLKDNTAGTTIPLTLAFGAIGSTITSPPFGNGFLSAAAGNVLTATGQASQVLSGYLFGTEE